MLPLLVLTAVNIISVPLFYRYLGPEMYALWFYVQTLSGSFGFMDLGLGTAVGRYIGVALGKGDTDAVKSYWATGNATAIPLLLLMAAVFAAIGVTYGPKWFNVLPSDEGLLRWSFVAASAGLFLSYYNVFWNVLSQAHLDFKFLSLTRIFVTLLQIGPAIVIARATGNPLLVIIWGVFVSVVQLAVFVIHARANYQIGLDFRDSTMSRLKEMSGYTSKAFGTLLIGSLFSSMDRLIVGKLAPPAAFTSYSIASNLGLRLSGLSAAAAGPVFHHTSRADPGGTAPGTIFDETFSFLLHWYALAVVWISVWATPLAVVWLGKTAGLAAAPLFAPLIVAHALTAMSTISSSQLGAMNRVGTQALFGILSGALVVPCVYIGWKVGGMEGLAYGFLVSRVSLFAQDLFVMRLIRARGWLASANWLHIGLQVLGGLAFVPVRNISSHSLVLSLGLAALHGAGVALWILRGPLQAQFSRWRARQSGVV